MPISGLVIEVRPGGEQAVAAQAETLPGVEVSRTGNGAIIVTTSTATLEEDKSLTRLIGELPDVLAVKTTFTSIEDCVVDGRR